MKQNWDFVSISDYQADMRESTERAAAVIGELRKRTDTAMRMLAEVVLAAGGTVTVTDEQRHRLDAPTLTIWFDEKDRQFEFRAERR